MEKERQRSLIGNLTCFAAYTIFGFNIFRCKNIALDGNVTPMALFCLRSWSSSAWDW